MRKLVKLISQNEQFRFNPVDPDTGEKLDAVILYRRLPALERKRLVKKNTSQIRNKRTGQMQEVVDWDQLGIDTALYCAQGWEGFIGEDDQPVEFNKENLLKVPDEILGQFIEAMRSNFGGPEDDDLGNSPRMSGSELGTQA